MTKVMRRGSCICIRQAHPSTTRTLKPLHLAFAAGCCSNRSALSQFYCGLDPGEIELYKVDPIKATTTRMQSADVQLLRATTLQKEWRELLGRRRQQRGRVNVVSQKNGNVLVQVAIFFETIVF
jgi:hypothetical protein